MFCRHCGTQLPDDSKFCIVCGMSVTPPPAGAPATPAKEYLAVLEGVTSGDKYNLYVTMSRFVLIKVSSKGGLGSVFGPVGSVLDAGISAATRKKVDQEMPLDEMLRLDKKNYVLTYAGVKQIKLSNSATGGRAMEVLYTGKGGKDKKARYVMNKEQVTEMAKLLLTIPILVPKLKA